MLDHGCMTRKIFALIGYYNYVNIVCNRHCIVYIPSWRCTLRFGQLRVVKTERTTLKL